MPRFNCVGLQGTEIKENYGARPYGARYDEGSTSHQLTTFHRRVLRGWSLYQR
jgi:hypothetical protein